MRPLRERVASRAAAHRQGRARSRPSPGSVAAPRGVQDVSGRGGARALRAAASARSGRTTCRKRAPSATRCADLPDVQWHLIGPLQSNKTARGGRRASTGSRAWIALKIAQRLSAQRPPARAPLNVLRRGQCERRSDQGRGGARRTRCRWRARSPRCRTCALRGIMGIPDARTPSPSDSARSSGRLRGCFDALRDGWPPRWIRCRWACPRISRRRSPKARRRCASAPPFSGRDGMRSASSGAATWPPRSSAASSSAKTDPRVISRVEPLAAQHDKLAERFPGIGLFGESSAGALDRRRARRTCGQAAAHARGRRRRVAPHIDDVPVVMTIAAGTRIADLSRWLGGYARIVRAMPNTPALIGAGISGIFAPASVDAKQPRAWRNACSKPRAPSCGSSARRCSTR